MLRGIRSHLTYANVMASVAVFVALGGASYAAVRLPRNSVGASQIKNNAVSGAKVRDQSLTAADFNGSVQGPQGATGAQGPKGDPGSAGPRGEQGPGAVRLDATAPKAPISNPTPETVATVGPMTLKFSCPKDIVDKSTVLSVESTADATVTGTQQVSDLPTVVSLSRVDLPSGSAVFQVGANGSTKYSILHLVYRATGQVNIIDAMLTNDFATNTCSLAGAVVPAT